MQTRNRGDYTISDCELVAEGADLRVQVLTLAAGQCVPWHYHTEISDSFVCLEGPMVVETRAPRHVYHLLPGERCAVPPKTAHYVHGEADGACKFLIVQGVGVYDFVVLART
jgi:quercetin dioxygenase-like cupin family protein